MTPFWMQPSRASTKRPTPELGAVLPHSTSNHLTRIWRNACGIRARSRSMAGAKQFAMQPESAKSLALIRRSSPTCSRSWAIGAKTAAQLLNRHGAIESFPPHVLGDRCDLALLFKKLATLRTDRGSSMTSRRYTGAVRRRPLPAWAERMEAQRLIERCEKAATR